MNHAANNIEANSKNLKGLLKERKYQVKYFQREYKWKKNHIEDLLIDLERSFFANYNASHSRDDIPEYDCYYMGPIVLHRERSSYVIVDGQQRLTSFTLLLIYLSHLQKIYFSSNQKKIQKLDEYIYSQPYEKETFNLEIKEREDILKCLYQGLEVKDTFLENESSRNILDRYYDIADLFPITLKHELVLPLFINWLVEKLIFIEILAQSSESAYTIFETMNDRGLNLTQSELLKSHLLSHVRDETKIKELDNSWKAKIAHLKTYSNDEDQDFFKAWLRGKYAFSLRSADKNSTNEDFEKIGNRFSSWVQENEKRLLHLDKNNPDSYFFFVDSDFQFFSSLYVKLCEYETSEVLPEHKFKFLGYKGVSQSLSYPFILSSILKTDDEDTINMKITTAVDYLDCFAIYRLLHNEPITQSSIDYAIYTKVKSIRDKSLENLISELKSEVDILKRRFLGVSNYIPFEQSYSKYLLARIYKESHLEIEFETLYFQRKKDPFIIFQFILNTDVDKELHKIPQTLRNKFMDSLCTYCIVPKSVSIDLGKMQLAKRIQFLIKNKYLIEFKSESEFNPINYQEFLIKRDKRLKEVIMSIWKL